MRSIITQAALTVLVLGHIGLAQEIESAQSVIQRLMPKGAPAAAKAGDTVKAPAADALQTKINALSKTVASLPPEEAATQWLALVDEYQKSLGHGYARLGRLLPALPTPAQWPAVSDALEKRDGVARTTVNDAHRLLFAVLRDDSAATQKLITAIKIQEARGQRSFNSVASVEAVLARSAGATSGGLAEFEAELATGLRGQADVPDLVTLAGKEKAEAMLRRALVAPANLVVPVGDATRSLARRLATEMADQLVEPQWDLTHGIDAECMALFEALEKKFPARQPKARQGGLLDRILGRNANDDFSPSHDYDRQQARTYYMLGLIATGRIDEARALGATVRDSDGIGSYQFTEGLELLDKAGATKHVYEFLKKTIEASPDSGLWDELVVTAAKLGRSDDVLKIAEATVAKADLSDRQRAVAEARLTQALLAAGRVEEGVSRMRKMLQTEKPSEEQFDRAVKLAVIGRVSKQPVLVEEGLELATKCVVDRSLAKELDLDGWLHEMALANRTPAAIKAVGERLVHQEWARQAAMKRGAGEERSSYSSSDESSAAELVRLYAAADRPADVLAMLDTFPQWEGADLVDLPLHAGGHGAAAPTAYYAAWALAKSGRTAEARRVLDYVLYKAPGLDRAYELLLEIEPNPIPVLDAMYALDQFEERPLIWKGVVLQRSGKLDEAEKTLRQAIAVDPSDGEQGKGDRMRVYAVLADVLRAKGDAKTADVFVNVIKSIRLSEDADDAWQAGLLSQAIKMYDEALTFFADAYCIQSRLAVQLAELGRFAEAEAHYRKAYELMPDSFGRVESHCFGCEGAFRSASAQSIAEQVFTRLAADNPMKPQLHYLLGYLRSSQEKWPQALEGFRTAVKLDDQYLNAWKKLIDAGSHVQLTGKELDTAALAVLRLDPLGRHSGNDGVEHVTDLTALWDVAAKSASLRVATPTSLYPLPATAAALAAVPADGEQDDFRTMLRSISKDNSATPGEVLGEVKRVEAVIEYLGNTMQTFE